MSSASAEAAMVDRAPHQVLRGHEGPVWTVAVSPDGRHLASGGEDGTVRIWDAGTGEETMALYGHEGAVTSVIVPYRDIVASGGRDGTIRTWVMETGAPIQCFDEHRDGVYMLATVPRTDKGPSTAHHRPKDYYIVSSGDDMIRVWTLTENKQVPEREIFEDNVGPIAVSANGRLLACATSLGQVVVRRLPSGNTLWQTEPAGTAATAIAISPGNRFVAVVWADQSICLYAAATGAFVREFEGHAHHAYSLAFSPDGETIVSCDDDAIYVWELRKRQKMYVLGGHMQRITSLAVTPDSRHIVSGGADGTVRVWQMPLARVRAALEYQDVNAAVASIMEMDDERAEGMPLAAYVLRGFATKDAAHWAHEHERRFARVKEARKTRERGGDGI